MTGLKRGDENWIKEKIGDLGTVEAIFEHVRRQVQALGLTAESDGLDVLEAVLNTQAAVLSNFGQFFNLVQANMPMEAPAEERALAKGPQPRSRPSREKQTEVARGLITKGIQHLKELPFNDFWDDLLWRRLTYNSVEILLTQDGAALLQAVLDPAGSEQERTRAVAQALAERFVKDIVKAEILESERIVIGEAEEPLQIGEANGNLVELNRIASRFLVAAEGKGIKCYRDSLPLSRSWARRLQQEVANGNEPLLEDLRALDALLTTDPDDDDEDDPPGFPMDSLERKANDGMAKILARFFPDLVISKLTPSTEMVERVYGPAS